ncbi:MAG TPA: adenylyl-sulfate kinase [Nitrososphaerales archaeon]|nr:adenylyl-sulfate kinase [Nitrososphaerales archaeon]
MNKDGTVIWFCGLPGSGKSTISNIVRKSLQSEGIQTVYLSMDELRKNLFPNPSYSNEERDLAYRTLGLIASFISRAGSNVIVDATAHKRKWRDLARKNCRNFVEIYIKCPVEICIQRETNRRGQKVIRKRLYLDALKRLKTGKKIKGLGKVPGVDERFEESNPEIVIDSSSKRPPELANEIIARLKKTNVPLFSNIC